MCTRNNSVNVIISTLTVLLLSTVSDVHAGTVAKPGEQAGKALTMGENQTASEKFEFNVEPMKKVYKIGEPIRLKLRGDKDYYLYLFNMNEDGGATMIFPKKNQKNNHFAAGRTYVMPGQDSGALLSNKGNTTEHLRVVASLKKILNNDDYESFDSAGEYYTGKGDFLKNKFRTKDIRWSDSATDAKDDVRESGSARDSVTRKISLKISDEHYSQAGRDGDAGRPGNMVLLSADKNAYKVGDTIQIMYGAAVDGVVTVAYEYEDSSRQVLQKSRIKAGELKNIKATAEAPGGKHTLLAWMGSGASKLPEANDYYDEDDASSKDIRVGDSSPGGKVSREVARFVIQVVNE